MREPTMSVKVLRGALLAGALRTGHSIQEVAASLGLSATFLADASARFAHQEVVRIWEALSERCADPSFGLFAAQVINGAPFDLIDYAIHHAATVGEMRRLFDRYQLLFHDANASFREETADVDTWVLRLHGQLAPSRHLTEFILATWALRVRRATGRSLQVRLVELAHPAPSRPGTHQEVFGGPVRFDAPRNALLVDRAVLDWPILDADPALRLALEEQARRELASRGAEVDFLREVRAGLAALLLRGAADMLGLARALAMSERTLQRRLHAHHTSFREELQRVHREEALAQLGRTGATVTRVALELGFSDLSSFSRAFRRWTGRSPREEVRRSRGAPTGRDA